MDDRDIQALIRDLGSNDYELQDKATYGLAKIGGPAIPALIDALKNKDWRIRKKAVSALAKIGGTRAVPALIDALKDENRYVRYTAATEAIGIAGDVRTVPALIDALKDEDPDVRKRAAWVIYETMKDIAETRDSSTALKNIKNITLEVRKIDDNYLRKGLIEAFANLTQEIHDKMNSVDKDKKFPVKKQEIKKQPKARRAILAS